MVGKKGRSGGWNKGKDGYWKGRKLSETHKERIKESCKNCPVVHHINGDHNDDRPENRMILTPKEHNEIHILQGDIHPYGNKKIKNLTK
jgi:hypothetical protein